MNPVLTLKIIKGIFSVLYLLVWARVILSWVPHDPYNSIIQNIYSFTELMLKPLRELIPSTGMGIDISPFILLFILNILESMALRIFVF